MRMENSKKGLKNGILYEINANGKQIIEEFYDNDNKELS